MSIEQIKDYIGYMFIGMCVVAMFGAITVIVADMLNIDEKKAVAYIFIFLGLSCAIGATLKYIGLPT